MRCFVAVWPPAGLVDRLRGLARPQRPGVRWTTEDQWHVTLRFLGDVLADPAWPEQLAVAGRTCVVAGPRPQGLGTHVWVLPVAGLAKLAAVVAEAAPSSAGDRRPFAGHITLARSKRRDGLWGLPVKDISFGWEVDEVTLVSSQLGGEGARYTILERWTLPAQ